MARTVADYDRAQEWLERLLKIREAEGKDELALARIQHDLAWCYEDQGEYGRAEPLYRRSLEIKEKSLGKEHPSVAATLNNLAELYKAQGRYEEAKPLYQRCLSILRTTFPNGHPNIDAGQANYDDLKRKMAEQ